MSPKYEYTVEVRLTRAQYAFLRDRYGRREGTSARTLVRMAVFEAVRAQAQTELEEVGVFDEVEELKR